MEKEGREKREGKRRGEREKGRMCVRGGERERERE